MFIKVLEVLGKIFQYVERSSGIELSILRYLR